MTTYKDAGVDVEAGYKAVRMIKKHTARTFRPEVLADIGGFGGLFAFNKTKYENPVLVSGTDGVGTKLKIAFIMGRHDTVGIDCVAMCANDVVCSGAEPLFFLDYIATGKVYPEKIESIVKGIAEGCISAGCSLIGGETAEMPGFYKEDEYDIAGFAVGVADRSRIIDGSSIISGDKIIGIASSGIHSNGFSLVRKLFTPTRERLSQHIEALGCTLGEELLKPTRIYVKVILRLLEKFEIKGIAHITGGGFIENIPRVLPEGLRVVIKKGSWPVLPVFNFISRLGDIPENNMFNTFNMGIGMVLVVSRLKAAGVLEFLNGEGEKAYEIGEVVRGEAGVEFC